MAQALCGDRAASLLRATDTYVLGAPAITVLMWKHPATRANRATLAARGIRVVVPNEGAMACGEYGYGRMAEPLEIAAAAEAYFAAAAGPLQGDRKSTRLNSSH